MLCKYDKTHYFVIKSIFITHRVPDLKLVVVASKDHGRVFE